MSSINKIKLSPLALFLIKAGFIYGGWEVLYQYVLLPDFWLDTWLSHAGVSLAAGSLSFLGWEIEAAARFICVVGNRGIEVQNGCNGLDLLGLYAGFIVAYPGTTDKRLYFLAGGLFFIFLANVFRIAAFTLTNYYLPHHMAIYHEYSSFIIFYPIVLTLWYLWAENSDQQSFLSGAGFSSA